MHSLDVPVEGAVFTGAQPFGTTVEAPDVALDDRDFDPLRNICHYDSHFERDQDGARRDKPGRQDGSKWIASGAVRA